MTIRPDKLAFARKLRRDMTEAERIMWGMLRNRRYNGFKFRRQVPIGPYIVDFLCESEKLILEIDGDHHLQDEILEKDDVRSAYLLEKGYRVIRILNIDVLHDLDQVRADIDTAL